jgi:hypothetical protein
MGDNVNMRVDRTGRRSRTLQPFRLPLGGLPQQPPPPMSSALVFAPVGGTFATEDHHNPSKKRKVSASAAPVDATAGASPPLALTTTATTSLMAPPTRQMEIYKMLQHPLSSLQRVSLQQELEELEQHDADDDVSVGMDDLN